MLFTLIYTATPGAQKAQISVSVSKKTAPKAVLRNKLRRRAYSALTPLLFSLPKETTVLVLYTSKDVKISIPEITKEFEKVFRQTKILK